MAYDPTNWQEPSSADPPLLIQSVLPQTVTMIFPFTIPRQQALPQSFPSTPLSGMSTTTTILQPDQLQALLASLQDMLIQTSFPLV